MKLSETEAEILRLAERDEEVSVRSVARALGHDPGDPAKRKAIQRVLAALQSRGLIVPKGKGRSRTYVRAADPKTAAAAGHAGKSTHDKLDANPALNAILVSGESKRLLDYLARPMNARTPVGYNADFLRTYEPNKTGYLSAAQLERLHAAGRVESIVRPAGTFARNIMSRLLIDLSWNSSRLEGNTYSLLETQRLIEIGEQAEGKDATEAQMILNHKAAIEFVVESADEPSTTSRDICSIHALLSENLLGDVAASGRLRTIVVGISGTTYVPLENPQLLREYFDLFVDKLNGIDDPFEQSIFSIAHLSYLQAFEDVNKRTARIVANIPLVKQNLRPLSFVDVDAATYVNALLGVYELNDLSLLRELYVWAYERSSQRYTAIQQSMGTPNPLKLRHRAIIHEVVRTIIVDKISGAEIAPAVRRMVEESGGLLPDADERGAVIEIIESEIVNVHEGNVARFKVRPSEFEAWKEAQKT